jgi:intraflagellar transport protein 80
VASSSSGSVIFGHVIEREKISKNLRAITTGRKKILLQDILTKSNDNLDFSDKILKWELNYGHLVVATTTQIHIFNENYVNTPIIIDGRTDVRLILLGKK